MKRKISQQQRKKITLSKNKDQKENIKEILMLIFLKKKYKKRESTQEIAIKIFLKK